MLDLDYRDAMREIELTLPSFPKYFKLRAFEGVYRVNPDPKNHVIYRDHVEYNVQFAEDGGWLDFSHDTELRIVAQIVELKPSRVTSQYHKNIRFDGCIEVNGEPQIVTVVYIQSFDNTCPSDIRIVDEAGNEFQCLEGNVTISFP